MSRAEENQELLNRAQLSFTGAPDKVMCNIEAQKLGILMDISKSLAVLADCCLDDWQKRNNDNDDPFSNYEEGDDGK